MTVADFLPPMPLELYPSSPEGPKPPRFQAIAAMARNRIIGSQGKIPWHIPEDFRWFKQQTMGGTLIMGRKTYESIGKPLPGRKTIVVSRQSYDLPGVQVVSDLARLTEKLSAQLAEQPMAGYHTRFPCSDNPPENLVVWVCGGTEIYRQLLPECMNLFLTRVKSEVEGDASMPGFEEDFDLVRVVEENPKFQIEHWMRKGWTGYIPMDQRRS